MENLVYVQKLYGKPTGQGENPSPNSFCIWEVEGPKLE